VLTCGQSAAEIAPAAATGRRPRILVAGLGNLLMGDDGVGSHACRAWRAERPGPHHLLVADVGTAIYDALHLLEWADRILVIDAMLGGAPPGTLYLAEPHQLEVSGAGVSLHDLSLLGALSIMKDPRPRKVEVLGVEPAVVRLGTELSDPVAHAIPALLREARRIVACWLA